MGSRGGSGHTFPMNDIQAYYSQQDKYKLYILSPAILKFIMMSGIRLFVISELYFCLFIKIFLFRWLQGNCWGINNAGYKICEGVVGWCMTETSFWLQVLNCVFGDMLKEEILLRKFSKLMLWEALLIIEPDMGVN